MKRRSGRPTPSVEPWRTSLYDTVARVFDKKGVAKFGEAQIPADAQIIHLRTIKKDGRTLEPEAIPEKEGVTLPAVGTAGSRRCTTRSGPLRQAGELR